MGEGESHNLIGRCAEVRDEQNQQVGKLLIFPIDPKRSSGRGLHLDGTCDEGRHVGFEISIGDEINAAIARRMGDFKTGAEDFLREPISAKEFDHL